jgi:hypothetical protein
MKKKNVVLSKKFVYSCPENRSVLSDRRQPLRDEFKGNRGPETPSVKELSKPTWKIQNSIFCLQLCIKPSTGCTQMKTKCLIHTDFLFQLFDLLV